MQNNGLWLILAMVVVAIGVFVVARNLRHSQTGMLGRLEQKMKNGLPIIAREDRDLSHLSTATKEKDALSNMAEAMAATPVIIPSAAEQEKSQHAPTASETSVQMAQDTVDMDVDYPDNMDIADDSVFDDSMDHEIALDFDKNSPVVDRHLDERRQFDQNNDPLLHATETVSIAIIPQNSFAGLPGRTVLEIAKTYGIKFGVMNLFHRYENEDGTGDLWFSVMGMGYEGVRAFDLNTLHEDHFIGLTLFLPLPHPHAVRGFDSMVSVATMIAQDLSADMLDEQGNVLTDVHFNKLRSVIVERQYGQA